MSSKTRPSSYSHGCRAGERKRDLDSQTAARAGACGDARAVCIGDRSNDRKPESEARWRPTIRRPPKRLEESRQLVGGDRVARVLYREQSLRSGATCGDCNPAARSVVADCVREDVVKEPLDQGFIAIRRSRFETNIHGQTVEICDLKKTRSERGDVDELAPVESGFASGENKACLEQSFLLHARIQHLVCDLAPRVRVRVAIGEGELEKRPLGRKR
jgi:hypothetical protein